MSTEKEGPTGTLERLKTTPRLAWEILIATWGIWLLNAFDMGVIFALGATLIEEFGFTSTVWLSVLAGLYFVRALFTLPWSILSDRLGSGWRRKRLWSALITFYSLISVICVIPVVALSATIFWPIRYAVQLFSESGETIGIATVSEWFPEENRGFAIGLHHTGFPIGFLIAGWASSWVLGAFGNDQWYLIFFGTLFSFPFLAWYYYRSTEENQQSVYQRMRNRGLTPPHGEEATHETASLRESLSVFRNINVRVTAIYIAVSMAVWTLWVSIFPAYMSNIVGLNYAAAAGLSVVWTLTGAFFQFFWPTVSDRIGRKRLLVVAAIWMGTVFLFLPLVNSVAAIIAIQLAYGVFLNAVYPLGFSMIADSVAEDSVATGISVSTTGLWVGGAIILFTLSPVISMFGGWTDPTGYNILYGVMVVLTYAIGLMMYVWGKETVGPKAETTLTGTTPEPMD